MGRRGPPAKPTILKILQGNPGKQKLNLNEPKPQAIKPKMPDLLTEDGKREWRRVLPELVRLGLMTRVDVSCLEIMCKAYGTWCDAERYINEHGTTYTLKDPEGNIKYIAQFPQVSIARAAAQEYRKFATEFGLTPASRSRINTEIAGPVVKGRDEQNKRMFGS